MNKRSFWLLLVVMTGTLCGLAGAGEMSPAGGVKFQNSSNALRASERRATAVSNWWKHKFKEDAAFSQTVTPRMSIPMAVGGLRQNDIEEERRS